MYIHAYCLHRFRRNWTAEGEGGGRGEIRDEFTQCAPENAEIQHKRVAVIEVETKKSACFKRMKEGAHRGWLIKSDDDKTFLLLLELNDSLCVICDCNVDISHLKGKL